MPSNLEEVTAGFVRKHLYRPGVDDDKYTRGVVLFATGSRTYPGAALLGAKAAVAAGASFVRLYQEEAVARQVVGALPQVVTAPGRFQVAVVGSGWDGSMMLRAQQVASVAARLGVPLVVDAGALSLVPYWVRQGVRVTDSNLAVAAGLSPSAQRQTVAFVGKPSQSHTGLKPSAPTTLDDGCDTLPVRNQQASNLGVRPSGAKHGAAEANRALSLTQFSSLLGEHEPRFGAPPLILTPHLREAAALLAVEPQWVKANQVQAAREIARRYRSVAVVKAAQTVVTDASSTYLVSSSNHYASCAGAGDVLAGTIAATVCPWVAKAGEHNQEPCLVQLVAAATWIHAQAAGGSSHLVTPDTLCSGLTRVIEAL